MDTDLVTPTTTTVIFADLVGYSAATEAHGDDTAAALALRLADLAATSCDPEAGDRLVKSIGDAVLCVSTSPENGLRLAARLNQAVLSEDHFPSLRTGLCQGSVVARRGDIFGAVVNLAARLAELAQPGEVLATTAVADAAIRLEVPVSRVGPRRLKNLHEAHEVFQIDFIEQGPDADHAIDPICHMRVNRETSLSMIDPGGEHHWFCSPRCVEIFVTRSESEPPA